MAIKKIKQGFDSLATKNTLAYYTIVINYRLIKLLSDSTW